MADLLKIAALEAGDLPLVSSLVQDALVQPVDMKFDAEGRRFALFANRYRWEQKKRWLSPGERIRTLLMFETVQKVQRRGFDGATAEHDILNLLSIEASDDGEIQLMFSGSQRLRLQVEAVEVYLSDTGNPWTASRRPRHK